MKLVLKYVWLSNDIIARNLWYLVINSIYFDHYSRYRGGHYTECQFPQLPNARTAKFHKNYYSWQMLGPAHIATQSTQRRRRSTGAGNCVPFILT